jgi:N-acetylmuramoyl-L-alanine amidase
MATSPSKAEIGLPQELQTALATAEPPDSGVGEVPVSGRDALQALLAFSALHAQVRKRTGREATLGSSSGTDETPDQFLLFEVLQLVAERARALTDADGVAIALVHEGDIVCRAASGAIAPDIGVKLDLHAGFSGFCLRTGESVRCDDTEKDSRVNREASHRLQARSMLAVPLCGRHSVLGLIEAFSTEAYGFTDSDLGSLKLLAELILGAMRPEEQEKLESLSPVAVHGKKLAPEPKPQTPEVVGLRIPERTPTLGAAELDALIRQQVEGARPSQPVNGNVAEALEQKVAVPEKAAFTLSEGRGTSAELAPDNKAPLGKQPSALPPLATQSSESRRPSLTLITTIISLVLILAAGLWWRLHSKTPEVAAAPNLAPARAETLAVPLSSNVDPVPSVSTPTTEEDAPTSAAASPTDAGARNLFPSITGVRHWESDDATTVVIDLQDAVQYEVHRLTDPERIYFDLHDTALAAGLSGKTIEVGDALLVRIRIAQPIPGVSRIVLETKDSTNFAVSLERNPLRFVVVIRGQTSEKKSSAKLGSTETTLQDRVSQAQAATLSKEDLQLRARVPHLKIVVDAGHGGWDLGTVGRQGLLEKDLVLDVTRRLGTLLQNRLGTEVVYTRPDDNYIPLEQRADIANQAQADLFVSVHANYSDYAFARGVETYYTNYSSSPESADIEKRENGAANGAINDAIVSSVALKERRERTDESRRLAASVERALYGSLSPNNPGMRDRGVKPAGFVVLTGTSMPAILSEISFVSSPMDEKNLQSSTYRQQIAEALYRGIARYAASSSRVKLAAASSKPSSR